MKKQETLKEAAENYGWRIKRNTFSDAVKANELAESAKQDFIEGANWMKERMYSEDEVEEIVSKLMHEVHCGDIVDTEYVIDFNLSPRRWFEQYKKK